MKPAITGPSSGPFIRPMLICARGTLIISPQKGHENTKTTKGTKEDLVFLRDFVASWLHLV